MCYAAVCYAAARTWLTEADKTEVIVVLSMQELLVLA